MFRLKKKWLKKQFSNKLVLFGAVLIAAIGLFFFSRMLALGETPPVQTLTDSAGNVRSNFANNDKANLNIRSYIDTPSNSRVSIFENFPSQVRYLSVISLKDKGGRSYTPTVNDLGQNKYRFDLRLIPKQYTCQINETACIQNAVLQGGEYILSDNYVDLKLEIEFIVYGKSELNTNFQGCENGPLVRISSASNVSYKLAGQNTYYKTSDFGAVCINVGEISPLISKSTYIERDGQLTKSNTFEAGDLVRVVLEIDEPNDRQSDYKITDKLPESVSGEIEYVLTTPGSVLPAQRLQINSDHNVIFEGNNERSLTRGKNKIEYQYRI